MPQIATFCTVRVLNLLNQEIENENFGRHTLST